jgi:hypothetical protein
LTYNWIKRSIFYEISNWKINFFCHNLEIMHIKKNMFENICNMVMDVKRKTKNNIKVRMDTFLFCYHKNIEFVYDGSWVAKPKVSFALDKNA